MRKSVESLKKTQYWPLRILYWLCRAASVVMPAKRREGIVAWMKRTFRYRPPYCRCVNGFGLNTVPRSPRIIVSLTSYPGRIKTVYRAIVPLLNQTLKPDAVVLWLGEDRFPGKETALPPELIALCKHGLSIRWCRDLRSYTKLIPALREYPDYIIITVDDDTFYKPYLVERLYKAYLKEPKAIQCNKVRRIAVDREIKPLPYVKWRENVVCGEKSSGFLLLGYAGVLYPPHSLDSDVFNESKFMKLAPMADDLWFWAMAAKAGTPVRLADNPADIGDCDYCASQSEALMNTNVGANANDTQFHAILGEYPMLKRHLEKNIVEKIALVLPYWTVGGGLPSYLNYFLRGLEGKSIDVLWFSDMEVAEYPSNFIQIRMAFVEFKALASEKLGIPVRLDSPKRLCDFKPMYGKIFEDWLRDYGYWAFGDCDLVYGAKFDCILDEVRVRKADVFSLERLFCCGPLCFIRNNKTNNELFKRAKNWVKAVQYSGKQCISFDELCGDWHNELRMGRMTLTDCARQEPSFSSAVILSEDVKFAFKEVMEQCDLSHGEVVNFDKSGELTIDGKPIYVYHCVRPKQRKYFIVPKASYESICGWVIDDAGFYVTNKQIFFRRFYNLVRKCKAAFQSLRKNGVARLSPRWSEQFRH